MEGWYVVLQQGISGNVASWDGTVQLIHAYTDTAGDTRAKSLPVRGLPRREKPRCGVYLLLSMCQALGGMSGTGWPGPF